jgi:hypothetical protein
MIQQIIARRNGVEHLLHGLRRASLILSALWLGSGCRHSAFRLDLPLNISSVILNE